MKKIIVFIPALILVVYMVFAFYCTAGPSVRTLNVNSSRADEFFNRLNSDFLLFQDKLSMKDKLEISRGRLETVADKYFLKFVAETKIDTTGDISFAKSVLAYLISLKREEKVNPQKILFIVREDLGDGKSVLELHLNKAYYEVHFPEYEAQYRWRGNIMSSNSDFKLYASEQYSRQRYNDTAIMVPLHSAPYNIFLKFKNIFFRSISENSPNISGWLIPGSWTYNHEPYLLVREQNHSNRKDPTATIYNFLHNESNSLLKVERNDYDYGLTYRVISNDWLKIESAKGKNLGTYTFAMLNSKALAKDMWLNGNFLKFYPLGNDFLYAYHLANFTSGNPAYLHQNKNKNLVTSFDYDLTLELSRKMKSLMPFFDPAHGGIAITMVDGDGRIKTMLDMEMSAAKPNPNDLRSLQNALNSLLVDYSSSREQWLLGNINLNHLVTSGPGSTFKPVVYFSAISQKKLDWDRLQFSGKNVMDGTTSEWFAGKDVIKEFNMEKNLELENNSEDVDSKLYLYGSRNTFHSLVLYLSSFKQSDLQDRLITGQFPIFTRIKSGPISATDFPVFSYNSVLYKFNGDDNAWPRNNAVSKKAFFGDENSILSLGLNELGLSVIFDNTRFRQLDTIRTSYYAWNKNTINKGGFILPALSYWPQSNRSTFVEGFQAPLLGGPTISVSPVKMAEIYLKIFTLNKNVRLTIDGENSAANKFMLFSYLGSGYNDSTEFTAKVKQFLYEPLNHTLEIGTAKYLAPFLDKKYVYYGKTGTTTGMYYNEESRYRNKFLSVVVSKDALHMDNTTAGNGKKIVVFYISLLGVDKNEYEKPMTELMKVILNSVYIKDYLHE